MSVDSSVAVAKLIVELGEVEGRKRLQKIVHLLQASGDIRLNYRFILHFFGPFCRELASDLDFLVDAGVVAVEAPGPQNSAYKYSVPEQEDRTKVAGFYESIRRNDNPNWLRRAKALGDEDTPFLEGLSTVVFLASHGRVGGTLKSEFEAAKPKLKSSFDDYHKYAKEHDLLPS